MARAARHLAWAGLYGAISTASAAELQVVVTNVRNDRGHIQVGVCVKETFLTDNCAINAQAKSTPGTTFVTVPDMPAGIWALQVYHDENDNEQVDRDLIGIPTEGIGFSNNAPFRFGPPSWDDARFELAPGGGRVTLRLRYFN